MRAYFSLHRKLRLPEKSQCFVQILTFKSHPWCVKTKLSCDASFNFQNLKMWHLRLLATTRNSISHADAATMNLNAAIPLRSADTELQNTIEWQRTTVGHILWTQQFQYRKCFNKCKTQWHSIIKEDRKSRWTISSTARAIRARADYARNRRACEPTSHCTGSSVYRKNHNVSCKS